jgi:hypothetical protein
VKTDLGPNPIADVWTHGDDGTTDVLVYNGDQTGDPTKSAPKAFYEGRSLAVLALTSEAAGVTVNDGTAASGTPAALGVFIAPNVALAPMTGLDANLYGGGTNVVVLGTVSVEPNSLTPSLAGSVLWIDPIGRFLAMTRGGDKQLVNDHWFSFTFAADADQVLDDDESRQSVYTINAGTITVPRMITSQLVPFTSRMVFVQNDNAQDILWAWSAGPPVTVPAGKMGLITGNGFQAVLVRAF